MKPLWTPWRMAYILGIKSHDGCVFCEEADSGGVDPDLVIHHGRAAFVVLNLYPYTAGHLMIVPHRHVASMADLTPEEVEESTALLAKAELTLEREYGMRRHHVGLNLGRCAGAGVEGHLHIHLVPRGPDDAPRPSAGGHAADGSELPEPLHVTHERLRRAWDRMGPIPPAHSSAT